MIRAAPASVPARRTALLQVAAAHAALTMAAVLGALATVLVAGQLVRLPPQVPVLAVVLTLTLGRSVDRGAPIGPAAAVELPAVALVAGGVGWLVVHQPWAGQPLLVVGLSAGILARRYGPALRRAGRLVTLPFLALLITPVPVAPTGDPWRQIVAGAAAALVAVAWTAAGRPLHRRITGGPGTSTTAEPSGRPRAGRRLDAPTRMAAQMATGLAAALVVGHLLFGDRWVWTVLSAFLVASGNRGRGDVVHKAGLRIAGAGAGTLLATGVAGWAAPGDRTALVALFAVMAVALVLRPLSYAFWAAGVTAMVVLLHGYYGQTGTALLGERLAGVLLGSLIGVAAAWFVLPVRTGDVLRRRLADCLAALTDDLAGPPGDGADGSPSRLPAAVARLEELLPALTAASRVGRAVRRRRDPHPVDAVRALRELAGSLPAEPGERRTLRRASVRVRRALVGTDDPAVEELPPALATVHRVLQATARRTAVAPGGRAG